jgi:hypothetical protein
MRVLRYMGGTAAPKRAARWSNRKLSLLLLFFVVVVVRQPLKKEAATPSHLLVRVQPHDTSNLLYRDMFLFRYDPFYFLYTAFEVIVQARGLLNQLILIKWEPLNSHGIFDIRSQILIELDHLGAFIPVYPRSVLGEPDKIFGYRCLLFKL